MACAREKLFKDLKKTHKALFLKSYFFWFLILLTSYSLFLSLQVILFLILHFILLLHLMVIPLPHGLKLYCPLLSSVLILIPFPSFFINFVSIFIFNTSSLKFSHHSLYLSLKSSYFSLRSSSLNPHCSSHHFTMYLYSVIPRNCFSNSYFYP